MAYILEEIAREEDRLASTQSMDGEDGEVDVEGDKQGIERLVNLASRWNRAKGHGRVLQIDDVPLGLEDAPGVQLVQFGRRKIMV